MWSSIKSKLILVGTVFIAVLLFLVRYLFNKNQELEHEIKVHEVKDEMQKEEAEFTAQLLADEQEEILKMTNKVNESDEEITTDDLNKL